MTVQFSLIIPTHNRPEQLRHCLDSLRQLDFPTDRFEIIVVDDGSDQPLDRVVEGVARDMDLRLIRQVNGGPALARNVGARAARGRYLAFTDDDCRPAPDWLSSFAVRLERHSDHLLGGRTKNALDRNAYAMASQLILDSVYAFYNRDPHDPRFFASNNLAVRADLFHSIGGFDVSFRRPAAEDRDLCDRWRHRGLKLMYAEEAVVTHAHALSLPSFCRQHFNYGRGAKRYHELRAQRGSGCLTRDLGMYRELPKLVRGPMAALPRRHALCVALLLAVWQVANAAGFAAERLRPLRDASKLGGPAA